VAAGDIKLSHSVFALPFAVLGAVLAMDFSDGWAQRGGWGGGWSRLAGQLGLVIVCMVAARTWAMLVNRLADARFDAANPRTAGRAVASGRLTALEGWALALAAAGVFIAACGAFWLLFANAWPLTLSLPVLGWLALYSYAKRFTALCHLLLGTALAISPIAAALAIDPSRAFSTPHLLLAAFVTCWVAGFDVIYALQDEQFDRRTGLHSIPAKVGARGAAWIARGLHVLASAALLGVALTDPPAPARFGPLMLIAWGLATALLIAEHLVLIRRGLAGLPLAFFTLNGVLSLIVGALGVVEVVR
jgi:4-hydroxybenzoate polyprenyltransferase